MTTSFSNKTIQVLIGLAFAFVFFLIPQKSFAACELTHGQFRNVDYGIAFPLNWFSGSLSQNNNQQPFVYLDLNFNQDCLNQDIQISILERDDFLNSLDPFDDEVFSDNFTFTQTANTLVFRAGDEECDIMAGGPNCYYYLELEIDGETYTSSPPSVVESILSTYEDVSNDYQWAHLSTVNIGNTPGYEYAKYVSSNDPDFLANNNEQDSLDDPANEQDSLDTLDNEQDGDGFTPATISCNNGTGVACIENPLGDGSSLPAFVQSLLGIIIRAGIPIVVLALVYTGFRFVLARGNPVKISEAKHLLLWTVIGSAVVLGAWTIATILTNTINLIIS